MQVVILAGGRGTRIPEETTVRPKPMVEIGGKPLLWHIMKIYSACGFQQFIIACGYKGELVQQYFQKTNVASEHDWQIEVIDTGQDTMTGGRMLHLKKWIGNETFMMTYGDGVGNIDISALFAFHRSHGKLATVTAVHPPARFGVLTLDGNSVCSFAEKPQTGEGWINGGFFVLEPGVLDYIEGDQTSFERQPLTRIASDGELMAFRHSGFWQPMDTFREKELLENLWMTGHAPWKIWP